MLSSVRVVMCSVPGDETDVASSPDDFIRGIRTLVTTVGLCVTTAGSSVSPMRESGNTDLWLYN